MQSALASLLAVILSTTPGALVAPSSMESKDARATDRAKPAVKDASLTARTKIALLADQRVGGSDISVDTANGVVTLRGTVATDDERRTAEAIARRVDGVASVNNLLRREPAAEPKAVTASDADVRRAVRDRFGRDARFRYSRIGVRADKGIVTLTGPVDTLENRARASELARAVPGVRAVTNDLLERAR